jgi:hypothetical protein
MLLEKEGVGPCEMESWTFILDYFNFLSFFFFLNGE